MKAKDLMTKDVVSVDKDERLETVLTLMKKHRLSKLVVTDNKHVVGVVTDGDIADELGALKTRGVPASQLHVSSAMRRKYEHIEADTTLARILEAFVRDDAGLLPVLHDRTCVGVVTTSDLLRLVQSESTLQEVMTTNLYAVAPSDRVIHARRLMVDNHVERLPVLDGGGVVGIVGEIDIAQGLAKFKTTVADNHQPSALQRFLVQDIMRPNVVTAPPEMRASDAAALMKREDVGSLVVVRGDRAVGIVTRSDLLKLVKA